MAGLKHPGLASSSLVSSEVDADRGQRLVKRHGQYIIGRSFSVLNAHFQQTEQTYDLYLEPAVLSSLASRGSLRNVNVTLMIRTRLSYRVFYYRFVYFKVHLHFSRIEIKYYMYYGVPVLISNNSVTTTM